MIELYYWTTPNGHKITIFLEEAGLDYEIKPVDIGRGEQFQPEFLQIAPNNRIPAIIDLAPADGGRPLALFESGAILEYLADKSGRFLSRELRRRYDTLQWLYWQMAGLGPMLGQNHHFSQYAPERLPYAINRYVRETERLYGVLDDRLADREYITGDYSIADMASYPWIVPHERQGMKLAEFANLQRWFEAMRARPAVIRAYERAQAISTRPTVDEDARKILFGQGRRAARG
jgi:GSH-dependent disulfide-bond oxidoreductase